MLLVSRRPAPRPLLATGPARIAVFRALQLGDMLCAVPALRALRTACPSSRITLVGLPWARQFASRFSHLVDDFLPFPGAPGLPEQAPDRLAWPRFLSAARAARFDLSIQMHGDGSRTNALVGLLGARQTCGFTTGPASAHFLPYPNHGAEPERLLQLTRHLGAAADGTGLEFPLRPEDQAAWDDRPALRDLPPRGCICLHPGARAADKRWPPQAFAAVGDALAEETGLPIVITGSGEETALAQTVADAMRHPAQQAAAPVPVGGLAALLAKARLLVGNDTGSSHLAAALGVPSVIVFRSTDLERWAPMDRTRHVPVWDPAGDRVDEVLAQARRLLAVEAVASA